MKNNKIYLKILILLITNLNLHKMIKNKKEIYQMKYLQKNTQKIENNQLINLFLTKMKNQILILIKKIRNLKFTFQEIYLNLRSKLR